MAGLDIIIRFHDPARLEELDRAVFSAALSDHRPLAVQVVCQRFDPAALAAVQARLAPIAAIVPEVTLTVLNRGESEPKDARAALLNLGLAAGQGRYAAFLDYDDVIYPEGHRLLIAELERSGAAIAFGGVLTADVSRTGLVPVTLNKRRVFQGEGLRQLLHNNFCPLHSFVLDRHRIPPAELAVDETLVHLEDYDLLLRLCARYRASFRAMATVVGDRYRADDGGATMGPAARQCAWDVVAARKRTLAVSLDVQRGMGLAAPAPGLTVAEAASPPAP